MSTAIEIQYVDTHPHRQVVSVIVVHGNGQRYRIGHLPGEGWFCLCSRAKRCPHIDTIRGLIPAIAPPQGAAATP